MAIDLPKSLHHWGNRWLWPSSHWSRHGGTWRKFTRLQYINPITGWYPEISIDIQSLWFIITGWWYTYPSAKNMSSSVGIMTYPKLFLESHKIPWFQSPPTSMGSHVFFMIFLWFSYGFLWFSYGFPMIFLWFSYGFPMVSYGKKSSGLYPHSLFHQLPASRLPHLKWMALPMPLAPKLTPLKVIRLSWQPWRIYICHWIGLRENLHRKPMGFYHQI